MPVWSEWKASDDVAAIQAILREVTRDLARGYKGFKGKCLNLTLVFEDSNYGMKSIIVMSFDGSIVQKVSITSFISPTKTSLYFDGLISTFLRG